MAALILDIPSNQIAERKYVADVVFRIFLGIDVSIRVAENSHWRLTDPEGCAQMFMPDTFFSRACVSWLSRRSCPSGPLPRWDAAYSLPNALLTTSSLPILIGVPDSEGNWFASEGQKQAYLGLDVLGSTFFMLTRYEEVACHEEDSHGRFPATASIAFKEGFLNRPIVNEYVELLWAAMKKLWPSLCRCRRSYRVVPTHDVDTPFRHLFDTSVTAVFRMGAAFLRRRSPALAIQEYQRYCAVKSGKARDPYDTFDWIMDQSEANGMVSTFYLKSSPKGKPDFGYSLDNSRIREVIERIHSRGHMIGFHPGYDSAFSREVWLAQYELLQSALPDAVCIRGGRQHYLRFRIPLTWRFWAESGLEYDTTLCFADHPGFRCGTCYPFPVFDLEAGKRLSLIERPLIAMETTILKEAYLGLGLGEEALAVFTDLARKCKRFDGEFILLWHNSSLSTPAERELYVNVLNHARVPGESPSN